MNELTSWIDILKGFTFSNVVSVIVIVLFIIICLAFGPDILINHILRFMKKGMFEQIRDFYMEIANVLVRNQRIQHISKRNLKNNDRYIESIVLLQEKRDMLEKSEFLIQSMVGLIKTMLFIDDNKYTYEQILRYLNFYFEELKQLGKIYNKAFVGDLQDLFDQLDYLLDKEWNEQTILSNDMFIDEIQQRNINISLEGSKANLDNDRISKSFIERSIRVNDGLKELKRKTANKNRRSVINDMMDLINNEMLKINNEINKINDSILSYVSEAVKENV